MGDMEKLKSLVKIGIFRTLAKTQSENYLENQLKHISKVKPCKRLQPKTKEYKAEAHKEERENVKSKTVLLQFGHNQSLIRKNFHKW